MGQEQLLHDRTVQEREEGMKQVERKQKRKEEEAMIANLEFKILSEINKQKEEDGGGSIREIGNIGKHREPKNNEELKPNEKGDNSSKGEWYWDDEIGWVQDDVHISDQTNKTETKQDKDSLDVDWYWDEEKGWVQEEIKPQKDDTKLMKKRKQNKGR